MDFRIDTEGNSFGPFTLDILYIFMYYLCYGEIITRFD